MLDPTIIVTVIGSLFTLVILYVAFGDFTDTAKKR